VRLAIFADIHGNSIALDAVLADVAGQGGVDGYVVLGDLAPIGADPVGVLERLTALPNARFVRGNGERYVVTGDRPTWFERERNEAEVAATRLEMANSFSWTQGVVTARGWFAWLAALPFDLRFALPDGTNVLAVHGTHRRDDEYTLTPARNDDELRALVRDAGAELILAAHTHIAMDRVLGERLRIVNAGCVSNPPPDVEDIRAGWALLDARADGYSVSLRQVEYDHVAYAESLRRVHHPAAAFIARLQRVAIPP
jgi:predicted phosphodiesterase